VKQTAKQSRTNIQRSKFNRTDSTSTNATSKQTTTQSYANWTLWK